MMDTQNRNTLNNKHTTDNNTLSSDTDRPLLQLGKKAIRGLAKRVAGYKLSETKTTYEINADGERLLKSEVITVKEVGPDLSAIIFALTNIDSQQWQAKPSSSSDSGEGSSDLESLAKLSEKELIELALQMN